LPLADPLPRTVKGLKLALSIDLGFHTVDEDVAANTRQAAAALVEAGAEVADYDALLCPTLPIPAPPVGRADQDFCYTDSEGRYRGFDMTAIFNFVSQCPVLSVPSGLTREGLPTGLQIIGRRFDDSTVLTIGATLEDWMPWRDRRPPI
jgi:Asp-tRNA(Asn)/Glu-tRNA(Gln) amidotransferase A subunit family amidase